MIMRLEDLYLIIAQLRIDMNEYTKKHEDIIESLGGSEEVRKQVYDSHLGRYMNELTRIIFVLETEALRQEEEKRKNEIRVPQETG